MTTPPRVTEAQVERMKQEARAIKRHTGEKHGIVLNRIAREEGFRDWAMLIHQGLNGNKSGSA